MPEIKRNFTGGKMNKDLDERLVPPGEYRHAQNVQVSTSEDSDVGTVTNILGNIEGCNYFDPADNPVLPGSFTVGSVPDEKNDTLYWLVAGPSSSIANQNFPLQIGQTSTFKDLIMRNRPIKAKVPPPPGMPTSICEPVFVDKWGFCTGIDPAYTWTPAPSDIIVLDDVSLYSSIWPGMHATGYVGQTQTWGPTLVTDVGNLTTIPINYSHGVTQQTTTSTPIILDLDVAIRTFIDTGCTGGPMTFNFDEITPCSSSGPVTTNIPPNGTHQFIILPSDWDPNIVVGSTMSQVLNAVTGANILNGVPDTIITDIQYHNICGDSTPATPPPGVWMTGCFNAYVLTIDQQVWQGSLTPSGTTDNGEVYYFKQFDAVITPPPTITSVPDNMVYVQAGSEQWMNEIYEILFDTVSGVPVATGATLQIDNLIGAGGSWPPDSCIDPNSVIDPNNGFSLAPPISYANQFSIVNCITGASQNALNFDTTGRPLRFTTLPQYGLQAVYLNDKVNLSNVETICFEGDRVLNFDKNRLITGINIVDDLLFWTDNFTEPKKINIPRSIQGTDPSGDIHTSVVNDGLGIGLANNYQPAREEHVTVIRKNPKSSLSLELLTSRDPSLNYTGVTNTVVSGSSIPPSIISSSNPNVTNDFSSIEIGDTVKFIIETDINGNNNFEVAWAVGDYLLLKEFTNGVTDPVPLANWTIRGIIRSWTNQNFNSNNGTVQVEIEIVGIKGTPPDPDPSTPNTPLKYTVDLEDQSDILFEDKFPRFSYRYRYLDGEYSTFAPFSEVAFVAGNFDYDPKRGWNTGMINNMTSVMLRGFSPQGINFNSPLGQDVMSVDILYKEEGSPDVYVVDTISPEDSNEQLPNGTFAALPFFINEYEVRSETIKNLLPSNQILRPWDNVPRKALAQEITGNRIVYGNYLQNYNLKVGGNKKFKPNFKNYLTSWGETQPNASERSIKSLRDYKLGVVFTDEYGRETPILISPQGGFTVEKSDSNKYNRLKVGLSGEVPPEMYYFKFYIKETSTEYYNLAMDRWYNAEDGNIWLAFPSSDRNKVDLETSLYFKKGNDEDVYENDTKYKILAIENEAPDFIKTRRVRIGTVTHSSIVQIDSGPPPTYAQVFGEPSPGDELKEAPAIGEVSFSMNYFEGQFANTSISKLEDITEDLYVQFISSNDSSSEYKIAKITSDYDQSAAISVTNPTKYFITLDTNLKNDIGFIFDNATSPSKIIDGIKIRFIKADLENKPKFDGRFFAKIENDGRIKSSLDSSSSNVNYITKASKMIYVLENDDNLSTRSWQAVMDSSGGSGNYILDSHASLTNFASNPQENPQGIHWNYYYARQAYFGLISNIPNNNYNPGGRLPLGSDEENGVWFIDRSTKKYENMPHHNHPNQLSWQDINNMNMFSPQCNIIGPPNCGQNYHTALWRVGTGIQNYTNRSKVSLGFGGFGGQVYNKLVGHYASGVGSYYLNNQTRTLGAFFAIGDGNPNHSDALTAGFVDRLQPGFSFVWEDDPTETIYTVEDQISNEQHLRFGRHDDGYYNHGKILIGAESSYHKIWDFKVSPSMSDWDPAGPVGTYMTNGLNLGTGMISPGAYTTFNVGAGGAVQGATTIPIDPSSDFSLLGIGMQLINSVYFSGASLMNEIISIDPVALTIELSHPVTAAGGLPAGTLITYGTTIRVVDVNIYGVTAGCPIDTNYIIVDRITSKCANGNNLKPSYTLKKGMMLTDYNLDGGIPLTPTYMNVIIKDIEDDPNGHKITLTGYTYPMNFDPGGSLTDFDSTAWVVGSRVRFRQVTMNGVSDFTEANTDLCSPYGASGGIGAVGYKLRMIEPVEEYSDGGNLPPNPFVWETEPKEDTGLDLYYEISENNPVNLNNDTIVDVIPVGSIVRSPAGEGFPANFPTAQVVFNQSVQGDEIFTSERLWIGPGLAPDGTLPIQVGSKLEITKPNGVIFEIEITVIFPDPLLTTTSDRFRLKSTLQNSEYSLNWYNCYSFANGVESNRIKDNFNLPFIINGVKVSTVLDEEYKEERRKYGLIYSGIYNSISGINNLNQFIQAEKITKDINSIYGSIQKLHAGWGQSGDLVTLCEDRTLKILANKDALFNADGNTNVTATNKVLGTAIPYSGDFGISTNPESFASESYRAYFTDKTRGSVMRLSMDGLTAISDAGMKNWFRDNLKLSNNLVGSYDDKKDQYNVTLKSVGIEDDSGNVAYDINTTVTYKENVKGWVSFKSFVPEDGLSCSNEYYTFKEGMLWIHHKNITKRNTFYNISYPTGITVLVNDSPGSIKTFHTLNYEGSKSKIDGITSQSGQVDNYDTWDVTSWDGTFDGNGIPNYLTSTNVVPDSNYYNLSPSVGGWFVKNIETDKEIGTINEFIEKEGKWFNYIKGKAAKYEDRNGNPSQN